MKRWMFVLGAVLVIGLIAGAGYLGTRSAQQETTPAVQAPTTVEVTRGDVQQTVTAPGRLVGTRKTALALDVSGKLSEILARPGEHVQAGDALVRIDPAPLEEKVAAAQADLPHDSSGTQLVVQRREQGTDRLGRQRHHTLSRKLAITKTFL